MNSTMNMALHNDERFDSSNNADHLVSICLPIPRTKQGRNPDEEGRRLVRAMWCSQRERAPSTARAVRFKENA